jgi:AbiTii
MTSLVLELQHEAMDPEVRVDDLLRKAVVVATTLGIDDFRRSWSVDQLSSESWTPYGTVLRWSLALESQGILGEA